MTKQDVMNVVAKMPDKISIEDVMYNLYILSKHNKAMIDIENGNVYTTDEVRNALVRQ